MSRRRRKLFRFAEGFLWTLAVVLLGFCVLAFIDARVFQASEERAFDRMLAPGAHRISPERQTLPPGALVGRIEIPGVKVRAMVIQGTEDEYLRRAVGHIEGTALPGEPGNVGLAGHRDTFFRGLRNVREGDPIMLRTLEGTFQYRVESVGVVGPNDVGVLKASSTPELTLVTCYPFHYIGAAPQRYIVRARQTAAPSTSPPAPGS